MKREWQKNLGLGMMILLAFLMYRFLDKDSLIVFVKQAMPANVAGLFLGIFMGDKSSLTKNWYEIFKRAGVLHVVVASGANLGIVAKFGIDGLAGFIGRKRAIVVGMLFVFLYVGLVGYEAPIGRALIVFFIYYWGQFLGRKFNMVSALILMFFVIFIVDLDILSKVSFWLSLVAFLAVVSFGGIKEKFFKKKKRRQAQGLPVLVLFLINIWISLWIWPITAKVFGEINWLSVLINPLVLFGVEAIFGLGVMIVAIYIVWPLMARAFLMLTVPFLEYFLTITSFVAKLDIGVLEIGINWIILIGWYLILFWLLLKTIAK